MGINLRDEFKKANIESFALFIIFALTWLGFGTYIAGFITLSFIFSLFFRRKREFIFAFFQDRVFSILLFLFVLNNVVSSLLSIEKTESALLSLVWFLMIFIPMSYVRFSLNKKNDFFIRRVVPVSFYASLVILVYLLVVFLKNTVTSGLYFGRYSFYFLGPATTPDTIVMLSGIGYGFLRQKEKGVYRWLGFLFILFCIFGSMLTYDRGGFLAIFAVSIILLSTDVKRLLVLFGLIGVAVYLILTVSSLQPLRHLFDFFYSARSIERLMNVEQFATFRSAWGMIRDHWLMGVGTNNFSAFSKQYGVGKWYAYAHNFILQFWAENGLFGMVFGLSMIGLLIYRWLKSYRRYEYRYIAFGVGASFTGMLIGNLTNSTIWIVKIALPFWLLAGVINAVYYTTREESTRLNTYIQ